MIDDETRRIRAYRIWESEGRPEGQDLAHWYRAGDDTIDPAQGGREYSRYSPDTAPAGSLIIKLYRSGDQIRGYVRKVAETDVDDTVFPGEEMEPEAAFKLAESHRGNSGRPVFVELVEDVEWDPSWGRLRYQTPS
ncbi:MULTISPECIES: DUF2934 domain-containing protein [Rhizobium]|uniref:DUF2934 domain-containing protein n=1 Tax=Rhizobium bangladeshense TaxID=1138189 RepID=A0ABS7LQL2_9HYPH|nr:MULTISPECIES: DUF2934 domain-containing protein [Rhizobium]MBX4870497.1 DUF2934 domain-containing protein [Rhizobium bangladeshense]MBX4875951.1 DUF2934 domain-containing protein [Rhizobium bangladeshense]MBX4887039.1 DUF2934 domain-containing protein [Rhizobium bangladeshense]MBX4905280.1 DUF2934 domain-containing protein [Rhizobium bangladeshense]MBX4917110.1 DUF2934 domain-containing protein [Rhizobium bangladeshense]